MATIIFCGFFLFAASLFLERGIPALSQYASEAVKQKVDVNASAYGRTRAIDVFLPFITIYLFGLIRRYRARKHAMLVLAACILGTLALLLGKANKGHLFVFFLGLLYMEDVVDPRSISFLSPRVLFLIFLAGVGAFMGSVLAEGGQLLWTAQYLVGRVLVYSWEGFNFIVVKHLPPDIGYQIIRFLSPFYYGDSPDTLLTKELLNTDRVPFTVLPTLFGFLYRNGGHVTVAGGFFILGFCVRSVLGWMEKNRHDVLSMTTYFFIYIMFLNMLLNGNVFDELRGYGLSILIAYLLLRIFAQGTLNASRPSPLTSQGG